MSILVVTKETVEIQIVATKLLTGDIKYNAVLHMDPLKSKNSFSVFDVTIRCNKPIFQTGEYIKLTIEPSGKVDKVVTKQSRLVE